MRGVGLAAGSCAWVGVLIDPIGMPGNPSYARATALEAERNASLCSFGCDNGGTVSQPSQPYGNLLLLGSFRGQPETCLGLSVF